MGEGTSGNNPKPQLDSATNAPWDLVNTQNNRLGYRCRLCSTMTIFTNRRELTAHQARQHMDIVGAGGQLQSEPWGDEDDPFDELEDGDKIKEVYETNKVHILAPTKVIEGDGTKSIYNVPVANYIYDDGIDEAMNYIYRNESNAFKVNMAVGVIIQDKETDDIRFFKPYTNVMVYTTALSVHNKGSLENAIKNMQDKDLNEYVKNYRQNTKQKAVFTTNIEYYVFSTRYKLGQSSDDLPEYIKHRRGIILTNRSSSKKTYESNLCVFVALAQSFKQCKGKEKRNVRREYIELFHRWCYCLMENGIIDKVPKNESFNGVKMEQIPLLEDCFKVNIYMYQMQPDGSCNTKYVSSSCNGKHVDLHVYNEHVNLITDLMTFSRTYRCQICERAFDRSDSLKKHITTCSSKTRLVFPGGYHVNEQDIFQQLETYGIIVPNEERYYEWVALYDMEACLRVVDGQLATEKSKFTHRHEPISFALSSNIPGWDKCAVRVNKDPAALINEMFNMFVEMRAITSELAWEKWGWAIEQLDTVIEDYVRKYAKSNIPVTAGEPSNTGQFIDDEADVNSDVEHADDETTDNLNAKVNIVDGYHSQMIAVRNKFIKFMSMLKICGFNSGKYDTMLIRSHLMRLLMESDRVYHAEDNADIIGGHDDCKCPVDIPMGKASFIKRNNNYICISNNWFKIMDIMNFVAQGTSLDKYMKSFHIEIRKYKFAYDMLTTPEALEEQTLMDYDDPRWYSSLKKCHILEQDIIEYQKVGEKGERPLDGREWHEKIKHDWNRKNWKNVGDWLMYYNSMDIIPFKIAVEKHIKIFRDMGIDMLNVAVGVPGIAKQMLFKEAENENVNFALCSRRDKDIYMMFKAQTVAGPSIVHTRLQIKDETPIKPGSRMLCKKVLGLDYNSLYPSIMASYMPTDVCIRRSEENKFVPEYDKTFVAARTWLKYREKLDGMKIISKWNTGKEVRVSNWLLDGMAIKNGKRVALEFQGCYFHAHSKDECSINKKSKSLPLGDEAALRTEEKKKFLIENGWEYVSIYECEFNELMKRDQQIREQCEMKIRNKFSQKHRGEVKEETILKGVMSGDLYGFILVTITTPKSMREYMDHFPPIFGHHTVSEDVIGTYMKRQFEVNNIKFKERKMLISAFEAKHILLSTDLARYYMELGLEIIKVHEVYEYVPRKPFEKMMNKICVLRREASQDPDKLIQANTWKTLQNSAYGVMLTDKQRYSKVKHVSTSREARMEVNNPAFKNMYVLEPDELYEIHMANPRIVMDLPMQVSIMILQNAKLALLKFYYSFLKKMLYDDWWSVTHVDTDSCYISIARENLLDCMPPENREIVLKQIYGNCSENRDPGAYLTRECCDYHRLFDAKSFGLMKVEWSGDFLCAIMPKTYVGVRNDGTEMKLSCKGVQKSAVRAEHDNIAELFQNVLKNSTPQGATNVGFRLDRFQKLGTFVQKRQAFTNIYVKRQCLEPDGIYTRTLPVTLDPMPKCNVCIQELFPKLTNEYRSRFAYRNVWYSSGLQALAMEKHDFTNQRSKNDPVYQEIRNKIFSTNKPSELNRLMNTRMNYLPEWNTVAIGIMHKIVDSRLDKDYGVKGAREQLMSSGSEILWNSDPYSLFWGTGLNYRCMRWVKPENIAGQNQLGLILMNKRQILLGNGQLIN